MAPFNSKSESWNVAADRAARSIGSPIAAPPIAIPVPVRWSVLDSRTIECCVFFNVR